MGRTLAPLGKYVGPRLKRMIPHLLPEEDALDDPDDDDEVDPTLPGDLWFRRQMRAALKTAAGERARGPVVYCGAFVPSLAPNHATGRSNRTRIIQQAGRGNSSHGRSAVQPP